MNKQTNIYIIVAALLLLIVLVYGVWLPHNKYQTINKSIDKLDRHNFKKYFIKSYNFY